MPLAVFVKYRPPLWNLSPMAPMWAHPVAATWVCADEKYGSESTTLALLTPLDINEVTYPLPARPHSLADLFGPVEDDKVIEQLCIWNVMDF